MEDGIGGSVAQAEEMRNAYKIFVAKSEGRTRKT
jgi:hypothetical protein